MPRKITKHTTTTTTTTKWRRQSGSLIGDRRWTNEEPANRNDRVIGHFDFHFFCFSTFFFLISRFHFPRPFHRYYVLVPFRYFVFFLLNLLLRRLRFARTCFFLLDSSLCVFFCFFIGFFLLSVYRAPSFSASKFHRVLLLFCFFGGFL